MFVVIHHKIIDPKKWDESVARTMQAIEQGQLPKGLKPVTYLPSTDGQRAVCLWETDSVDTLRKYEDSQTTGAAHNEYFQVNLEHAMGLPTEQREHAAAH